VALSLPAGGVEREPQELYRKILFPGLIRVRFIPDAPRAQVDALLRQLGLSVVRRGEDYWVVKAPDSADLAHILRALNASPLVDWAVQHYTLVRLPTPLIPPIRPQGP